MHKLILRNFQSPGDIVMLTAAVRDLHRCHPGEHNPYLTPLCEDDPELGFVHRPVVAPTMNP